MLRLYFLDDKNEENLQKLIEEESIVHQKKLEYLIKRQKDLFGEDEKNKKSGHYLVLDFAIQRETFKKEFRLKFNLKNFRNQAKLGTFPKVCFSLDGK